MKSSKLSNLCYPSPTTKKRRGGSKMWPPLVNVIIIVMQTWTKRGAKRAHPSSYCHGVNRCATMATITSWQQARKKTKGRVARNRILPISSLFPWLVGSMNGSCNRKEKEEEKEEMKNKLKNQAVVMVVGRWISMPSLDMFWTCFWASQAWNLWEVCKAQRQSKIRSRGFNSNLPFIFSYF